MFFFETQCRFQLQFVLCFSACLRCGVTLAAFYVTWLPWSSRRSVASPGFVARRGKAGDYVMGHSRLTSGPGAAAAWWLIVLWLMQVVVERTVSCWHLHQLISQTIQYLDSWQSDLLQSELKMKLLEVGGTCPSAQVPHLATQLETIFTLVYYLVFCMCSKVFK